MFLIGDFCLSFKAQLGFLLDQFSKELLCKMIKERAILIESCVEDQKLAKYCFSLFYMSLRAVALKTRDRDKTIVITVPISLNSSCLIQRKVLYSNNRHRIYYT
jgi:hypothetical protein